jgi:hypothetical protein
MFRGEALPVGKTEHDRANFANRILHEIGDEDIWIYREACKYAYQRRARYLATHLSERYGSEWPLVVLLLEWLG